MVGGGVLKLLRDRRADIAARLGRPLRVVAVAVRNAARARKRLHPDDAERLSPSWQSALAHPEADIAVELIGGANPDGPAGQFIRAALAAGKPVVTANKALLAENGGVVFSAARRARRPVAFEAAVAGCVPVVKALREALAADRVMEVRGVINGTCNHILTKMESDSVPFARALADAQKKGYAEADPALDIDGGDSAHKLALVARLAFAAAPPFSQIPVRGARAMDLRDIHYAREFGCRVKLLAVAKKTSDGIELRVQPGLVPREHLLARVEGAMNAVVIRGEHSGETMYSGAGAGAEPTAAAVVADLMDIVRNGNNAAPSGFSESESSGPKLVPLSHARAPHYLRMRVTDRPGVLADAARILADRAISIEAIRQNESAPNKLVDVVMLTHSAAHGAVLDGAHAIEKLPAVSGSVVVMMMEGRDE